MALIDLVLFIRNALYLILVDKPKIVQYLSNRVLVIIEKLSLGHMTEHIQSSLLHSIHKLNKGTGRPRIVDQQQNLWPPEFDVVFARIQ